MRIAPIGISASNLSVFWPLWDAALLRRHGRARSLATLPVWRPLMARLLANRRPVPLIDIAAALQAYAAVTDAVPSAAAVEPQPDLDLLWPSDQPIPLREIIVVERWLREDPPPGGDLIDVLY